MSDRWYLMQDNQERGPLSLEELKLLANAGQLRRDDRVRSNKMSGWIEADRLSELFSTADIQKENNDSSLSSVFSTEGPCIDAACANVEMESDNKEDEDFKTSNQWMFGLQSFFYGKILMKRGTLADIAAGKWNASLLCWVVIGTTCVAIPVLALFALEITKDKNKRSYIIATGWISIIFGLVFHWAYTQIK